MPVTTGEVVEQLLLALQEGVESTANSWAYFSDNAPESSLLGTLAQLSAAEASQPVGGSSVAAHAWHLLFGCRVTARFIAGDRQPQDWGESWKVGAVDDAAWQRIQAGLRQASAALSDTIRDHAADDALAIGATLGGVTHLAYHLGAIRQKVAVLRSQS